MRKAVRVTIVVIVFLTVIVGGFYLLWLKPVMLRGRQIRSCADMYTLRTFLNDYRDQNGEFPRYLAQAIPEKQTASFQEDGFGYLFHFESRPDAFILVSFGVDGRPDGTDYWSVRNAGGESSSSAREVRSDQLLSNLGWHREGCK